MFFNSDAESDLLQTNENGIRLFSGAILWYDQMNKIITVLLFTIFSDGWLISCQIVTILLFIQAPL